MTTGEGMGEFPRVSIGALGGTIAMQATPDGGVVPTLTAELLVESIPDLGKLARISAVTLSVLPGASLAPTDVVAAVQWAADQVNDGASGVVITQGTDTLEETAFLAGLIWNRQEPLVFTGAMRSPAQPSADGPANVIAACRTALSEEARGRGALVVLNDQIHDSRWVQKSHSTALQAFTSPDAGPVGIVVEQRVQLRSRQTRPEPLGLPSKDPYIPLLETYLGDDGATLRAVRDAGADGVVVAAFGVGHVSAALAREIEETARTIPVVVSSRTQAGGTLKSTYGFEGSEMDLARRGAVLSGSLDPRKSRLLAWLLLASGVSAEDFKDSFERSARVP